MPKSKFSDFIWESHPEICDAFWHQNFPAGPVRFILQKCFKKLLMWAIFDIMKKFSKNSPCCMLSQLLDILKKSSKKISLRTTILDY